MHKMKDKAYNPGTQNQQSPADGMAAVDTGNPEERTDGSQAPMSDKEAGKESERQNANKESAQQDNS